MNDPRSTGNALLAQIQLGLAVYDADGQQIGTVRRVEFGAGEPDGDRDQAREAIAEVREATATGPDAQSAVGDIAFVGMGGLSGDGGHPIGPLTGATPDEDDDRRGGVIQGVLGAFDSDDDAADVPDALTRTGFIAIDSAGLFAADRYAAPDQIAAVDADGVRLGVPADQLIAAG